MLEALPAAAQPGGPCPIIPDDALTQLLGSPQHAVSVFATAPSVDSGTGPHVTATCVVGQTAQNAVVMTHMVGVQSPGDLSGTPSLTQGTPGGIPIDPSAATTTQISGLGDAAVLLTTNRGDQPFAMLVVWSGSDGYSFQATGLSDAQTTLTGLAQAVLAGQ
jgi:hypothetical protein